MKDSLVLDVYCLVPYRNKALREAAPPEEEEAKNREVVWAFKNGRTLPKADGSGRRPLADLIARIVAACGDSPLAPAALDTAWVPVPRSGASEPSNEAGSDLYPCLTLAETLTKHLGGSVVDPLARRSPLKRGHAVAAGIANLVLNGSLPSSPSVVLLDDVFTTGTTLVSCAAFLRKHGYPGTIAALCIGYAIAERDAHRAHPRKQWWRIEWLPGHWRPTAGPAQPWGDEAKR